MIEESLFWERAEAIALKHDLRLSRHDVGPEEVRWGTLPRLLRAMFFERRSLARRPGEDGPLAAYITSNGAWLVHGASDGFELGFDAFERSMDLWALRRKGETIETAAIRVDGEVWTLPRPARHDTPIKAWQWAHQREIGEHEHGFVTSLGRFVDRTEGAKIAYAAGQISRDNGFLVSEDLW